MAIPPEDLWAIAISGAMQAFIQRLASKEFMRRPRRWSDVARWPARQLQRLRGSSSPQRSKPGQLT